jgi:hypothetical protein
MSSVGLRDVAMTAVSTRALRTSPAPSRRLWRHLLQNVAHVAAHGLRYLLAFRIKYA